MAGAALKQAEHSLNFAHVVAVMADAPVNLSLGTGLTRRELALASSTVREVRALLILLNKLDLLPPLERAQVRVPPDRNTLSCGKRCLMITALSFPQYEL